MSEDEASHNDDQHHWFLVSRILGMNAYDVMMSVMEMKMPDERKPAAGKVISRFHDIIHNKPLISYYLEEGQELSKVLNIFIRMNSGGTTLSYSDLLLSIAVTQWSTLDARDEIHKLVDEMNQIGNGFSFSKDLVLKAGLC
ncbi:hypothetical protein L477_04740 [Klebsiella pneumoniae BIDMC 40]|uniref:DUF262 domain-containing protein n=1 Tax=Klebsiella pneumoniae TaxID=573 RepID=UPI0003BFB5F3|nr:DUF262 domain-containing protein [Klebsiella pneumoniae]ESL18114.1 hypothetical protein L477_04740 [Klebsiella pneumoniae BIDMC 40]